MKTQRDMTPSVSRHHIDLSQPSPVSHVPLIPGQPTAQNRSTNHHTPTRQPPPHPIPTIKPHSPTVTPHGLIEHPGNPSSTSRYHESHAPTPPPCDTFVIQFNNSTAKFSNADCEAYMKTLGPQSIDLFVTSPPYFIGKEYDPSKQIADFEQTIARLLPNISRALKAGGSVCWQLGNHVSIEGILPLDFCVANAMKQSNSFRLRNRIIWAYSHGTHARRRFSGRHETILWYTKGTEYYFDLDAVRVPQKYPGKKHYKGPNKGDYSGNPLGKNPGDYWESGALWEIPNVKANHIEKTAHPCQFPVALVQRLVLALCPPSGVVLDPFMGSGTTAVASLLHGRHFRGCDISAEYLHIAASRLHQLTLGTLKYRLDTPIHGPSRNQKVAMTPDHFHTQQEKCDVRSNLG